MARMPSLLRFLIWSSSISIAWSKNVTLGGDIASLVPACAQPCLVSFIESNYPTAECGTNSTLPCLCPVQSVSGLTVGEAALQCLFAYAQLGLCDKQDVNAAAPAKILNICSGQANAIPNTHPTLTATLIIPSSGVPILLPPTTTTVTTTITKSTKTSSATASVSTTLVTSTSTSSTTTTSSHSAVITSMVMTSLPTLSPTSSLTSSSTSSTTPSSTAAPAAATRLAAAQIAGIAVGVAGAIAIAVGAIVLAKFLRHRRYPDSESGKVFFDNNNNDSTAAFNPTDSRGSRIFHISPPVLRTTRYEPDFVARATAPTPPLQQAPPSQQAAQPEPPVQSPKLDRNTIGLAISRPRSLIPARFSPLMHSPAMSSPRNAEPPKERRASKLLPERPALTLEIPTKATTSRTPSSQGPPTKDRASTLTNMTAFADLDSEAAEGDQVWRPPTSDPLSATTLYVADKYGNWVLSNNHRQSQVAQIAEVAELDTYTPMTKSPIERQEEARRMAATNSATVAQPKAPEPTFLSQDPANWTNSQTSSFYSQGTSARQSGRRNSAGRYSGSRFRKNSVGPTVNRSDSKASATTIHTSTSGGNGDGYNYESDVARLSQLSPVEESPAIVPGRSRVNYPKIPGRLDGATIRFVPPPRKPDFGGSPMGQPSPTLGALYPSEGSPSAYPPPLNPRRNERRLVPIQREGSGFTPEPPNVEVYPVQSPARPNASSGPESGPHLRSGFAPSPPTEQPYRFIDPRQQDAYRTPTQRPSPTFTPSPPSDREPSPPRLPSIMNRGRPHIYSERMNSGTSFGTVSSNASSLLAKRLGNDRAAALALDPSAERAQQWRRQGGVLLSPDDLMSPRGTLPQTPIWQPKLTPTRRGDDLYLNVQ